MEPQQAKRATIADVARAAGVSPATVSQAFNGRRQVDPTTRERIQAVALELGYRPNPTAQRLRTGRSGMIALLSSMPFAVAAGPSRLGFLMEIAAVAAGAALSNGLALILVPPAEHGQRSLDALGIDGAILVEPAAVDPDIARLRERGLPFVSVGKVAEAEDIPFVDLHSAWTTSLLLQHLWAQGARQIALVVGRQARNSYLEAETAYAGFAADRQMRQRVLRIDETGGEAAGREACRRLLAEDPEIDGICAMVDAFAVGALQAAHDLGRAVPADLKLATRYDGPRAREATPPLTAVNLHLEAVAEAAIVLLFEHLQGHASRHSATGPLPELVARASSAAGQAGI